MLLGRENELAALAALHESARTGHGAAVLVHGEPGVGKSALLEEFVAAASGPCVLRAAGVPPESRFGYATLHQLLLPVSGRADRLPAPLASALRVVFGLAEGPAPDRFLVSLATLSLLAELAREHPVVCSVDDVHWIDEPSRNVLEFVARRLDSEPIMLVLAARSDGRRPFAISGVHDMPVRPLDNSAARRLLRERSISPLSPEQQDAVLAATGGNPSAIIEFPAEAVRNTLWTDTPLPLTDTLRTAFGERIQQYSSPKQRLLLLAATAGRIRRDVLARAAAEIGEFSLTELDESDDLIAETDVGTITVRHPLVRSAVYHGALAADRRNAHRALAAALRAAGEEDERYAGHLARSVDAPDDEIAEQLDRAARRAARVASKTSAALFARAGELSTAGQSRARRIHRSAVAWWNSGDVDRAELLLQLADSGESAGNALHRNTIGLRALIELRTGIPADAVAMVRPLLPQALEADPRQAIPLLLLFDEACYHANTPVAAEIVDAVERLPLAGTDARTALLRLFRGVHRRRRGLTGAASPADMEIVETFSDPVMLCWASRILRDLGDRERARRLNREAVRIARSTGATGIVVWALQDTVGDDIADGRFRAAEAAAAEGYRLAERIGHCNVKCWHRGALAVLAACTGRRQRAHELAYDVLAEAVPRRLGDLVLTARRALGLLDLAAGRPDSALTSLQPPNGFAHPDILLTYTPDLVEAAVHAREPDLAAEFLEPLLRRVASAVQPEAAAVAARCRALVATPDTADAEFRRALALHERGGRPLEYARTRLLYGEYLRRRRHRAEAHGPLRAALDTFEALGAAVWADRARAELRALGETFGLPEIRITALTQQETRIVDAVTSGSTNREIAAQLVLSARTVDHHLRKIFGKLGVKSRSELIRVVLDPRYGRRVEPEGPAAVNASWVS
ncbi:ATP-binding protein [Nocardia blacklockiae]|uniref:ATP-binding protein n=1 Tax=Nocardia blacklockiae TaxID=480036 RepID=UPI001894D2F0|nr:LuxR family transcriptional regulator [Nocardia blacklockiae]MBF6169857.1 AAA family ATPase [Nocardia blacklockiae]